MALFLRCGICFLHLSLLMLLSSEGLHRALQWIREIQLSRLLLFTVPHIEGDIGDRGVAFFCAEFRSKKSYLGRVRLRSIRIKSKRLFGSYSHSGIPGFPYSGIYSYSGISQTKAPLAVLRWSKTLRYVMFVFWNLRCSAQRNFSAVL